MRERTNRTVSKTVVSQGTVGSNPTPSASSEVVFRLRPSRPNRGLSLKNPSHLIQRIRICHGRNDARGPIRRVGAARPGGTRSAHWQAPADQQNLQRDRAPGVQGAGEADDQRARRQSRRRQQDGQGAAGPPDRSPGGSWAHSEDHRRLPVHNPSPTRTSPREGHASAVDSGSPR